MSGYITRFALMLLLAPGAALAEPGNAGRGEETYQDHCATCHGLELTGKGPMAGVLLIAPVNLSRLQADNGDVFPTARVVKRIDGREPLVSHGSPMPVYGGFLTGKGVLLTTETGQPIVTTQALADLVAYLRAHQLSAD
ncbi:MAG: cytochrome c [Roseovarius sp.]